LAEKTRNTYTLADVLSPRAKEALRHLELTARRIVEGFLHGEHRSKRKGYGADFDHLKSYQPGDALKHIDWKVSARHDRYYVRRYLEETALRVRLVVDRSASMLQATPPEASKYLQAARVAACLAYLVLREGDSVGAVLTSAKGTLWLPVRSINTHLVAILRALIDEEPAAEDNLSICLRTILDRAEQKGIVAVISDMMYDPEPVQRELARLQAQGHEVLLFQLRDPTEEDFPFNRWVQFHDLEHPAVRHRLDASVLKRIYRQEYQDLVEQWRSWAKKYNVHFVTFRTTDSVETVLSEYVAFRGEVLGK
jgi:uncharacterized protein (DUF58 family)